MLWTVHLLSGFHCYRSSVFLLLAKNLYLHPDGVGQSIRLHSPFSGQCNSRISPVNCWHNEVAPETAFRSSSFWLNIQSCYSRILIFCFPLDKSRGWPMLSWPNWAGPYDYFTFS